jgi:M6 family metalloprotease-like protein
VTIIGNNFSDNRELNRVRIGGQNAYVVEASVDRLLVITHPNTITGPVEVEVDSKTALGPRPFEELPWPKPQSGNDGPPYSYAGRGTGSASAGAVPSTGTARILVVACNPTDLVPPDPTAVQQAIVDTFSEVTTFYDQASYGQLSVEVAVTTFVPLLEDSDYYHRTNGSTGYPNIDNAVLGQLMAECAQGAVDQGLDLDNYVVMVAAVHMPGLSVRAWGGWSSSNFAYDDGAGISINITTSNPLGLIAQSHTANWGRAAHEFAHNMLDGGLVLGEDVYASDLVDSSEATAAPFAMMGNHDSHPLFSAFNIVQLGWYDSANVARRDWDRNPFSEEFDIVAHDLAQDANASRVHILEIRVTSGLSYFVEVRQRPDATATNPAVFDEN